MKLDQHYGQSVLAYSNRTPICELVGQLAWLEYILILLRCLTEATEHSVALLNNSKDSSKNNRSTEKSVHTSSIPVFGPAVCLPLLGLFSLKITIVYSLSKIFSFKRLTKI